MDYRCDSLKTNKASNLTERGFAAGYQPDRIVTELNLRLSPFSAKPPLKSIPEAGIRLLTALNRMVTTPFTFKGHSWGGDTVSLGRA